MKVTPHILILHAEDDGIVPFHLGHKVCVAGSLYAYTVLDYLLLLTGLGLPVLLVFDDFWHTMSTGKFYPLLILDL